MPAAGVLGGGVHHPVAVGERLQRPVRIPAHAGGVAARLGRLAQRVGRVADRQAGAVRLAGQVIAAESGQNQEAPLLKAELYIQRPKELLWKTLQKP